MARAVKNNSREAGKAGLPVWDLSDLYPWPDSDALKKDLAAADAEAAGFHKSYFGKVGKLSGAALGKAVEKYEAIDERLSRIMSYAQLVHAGDVADPAIGRFYQTNQEAATAIASRRYTSSPRTPTVIWCSGGRPPTSSTSAISSTQVATRSSTSTAADRSPESWRRSNSCSRAPTRGPS